MKLLILLGLFIFFLDDFKTSFLKLLKIDYAKIFEKFKYKKRPLYYDIKEFNQGKKLLFITKALKDMEITLNKTGEKHKLKQYKIFSVFCGIIAGLIALYCKAYILVPINLVGFSMIPMWFVKFKDYRYRILVNAELTVALSSITNSFNRTENFIKSVEENLSEMNYPVKETFQKFLSNYHYVNPSIADNLLIIQNSIKNPVFKLWCENILMCLSDINHKDSLNAILDQLNADKEIQDEVKLIISQPIQVMFLSVFCFPLLYLMEPLLLDILFDSFTGQFLVTGLIISLLITTDKAVDSSTKEAI